MKQIEIDSHIENWYNKFELLKIAESALRQAQNSFDEATRSCASKLVPQSSTPEQRWILPSTGGRMVVCYMKPITEYPAEGNGKCNVRYEPTCEAFKI